MAEDLNRKQSTPSFAAHAPQPDESLVRRPPAEWESAPHAGRFLLAYAALGLILSITVIGLAVALTRDDAKSLVWSSWQPAGSGTKEVDEIVNHVADRYRLPSGRQMVAVIPRSPKSENPPLTTAAIDKRALFSREQQFSTYPLDNSMLYYMCGGGDRCAISEGAPSADRQRLLRREALELALYTFHYVHGVDSVVTFMPPNPLAKANQRLDTALFFRKNQYGQQYKDLPLADTLPGRPSGLDLPAQQKSLIDKLTYPAFYEYQRQSAGDGSSAVMILSPLPLISQS